MEKCRTKVEPRREGKKGGFLFVVLFLATGIHWQIGKKINEFSTRRFWFACDSNG